MNNYAWSVSGSSQLAILLEVSSPKPGNVNRNADFSDIGYRHFLASAALIGKGIHHAAEQGHRLAGGELTPADVGLGNLILETATDVFTDLNGSNTILGTIILHVPLAVAISATLTETGSFKPDIVTNYLRMVIDRTTVQDTIDLYKALHIVNPRGERHKSLSDWTEIHNRYDIENPHVYDNIVEDRMTLGTLFKESARVDRICQEWSQYYHSTLFETLPFLQERMTGLQNAEEAIVDTFVWRLSLEPDSHIIKRAGLEAALQVQRAAKRATHERVRIMDRLKRLDEILRNEGNLLNPGTTADLVSCAVFCRLVEINVKDDARSTDYSRV